jgi:hypothetical protein
MNVILPTIVIRRIERVLIDWRERKMAEIREKHPGFGHGAFLLLF